MVLPLHSAHSLQVIITKGNVKYTAVRPSTTKNPGCADNSYALKSLKNSFAYKKTRAPTPPPCCETFPLRHERYPILPRMRTTTQAAYVVHSTAPQGYRAEPHAMLREWSYSSRHVPACQPQPQRKRSTLTSILGYRVETHKTTTRHHAHVSAHLPPPVPMTSR